MSVTGENFRVREAARPAPPRPEEEEEEEELGHESPQQGNGGWNLPTSRGQECPEAFSRDVSKRLSPVNGDAPQQTHPDGK
ncbi:MAG: hypothetical protein LBQ79_12945 [Deltaproteobacteria bacterium]|nr:hypothetical protein [Deltaproteobacteria bacterium]